MKNSAQDGCRLQPSFQWPEITTQVPSRTAKTMSSQQHPLNSTISKMEPINTWQLHLSCKSLPIQDTHTHKCTRSTEMEAPSSDHYSLISPMTTIVSMI